jgi:hypothetical protein
MGTARCAQTQPTAATTACSAKIAGHQPRVANHTVSGMPTGIARNMPALKRPIAAPRRP